MCLHLDGQFLNPLQCEELVGGSGCLLELVADYRLSAQDFQRHTMKIRTDLT
jgi:hypothetical protein